MHLANRLDSFKRFARLWHWSRELVASGSGGGVGGGGVSAEWQMMNDAQLGPDSGEISVSTIKYAKMKKTFERSLMIVLEILASRETPGTLTKLIKGKP